MSKAPSPPVHLIVCPHPSELRKVASLRGESLLDRMQLWDLTRFVDPGNRPFDGSLLTHPVQMLDTRHVSLDNAERITQDLFRRAVIFDFTAGSLDPDRIQFFEADGRLSEPGQPDEPLPDSWQEALYALLASADVVTCSYRHMIRPLKKINKRVMYVPDVSYGDPSSEAAYIHRMAGVLWAAQRQALRRLKKPYADTGRPLTLWTRLRLTVTYASRLAGWHAYARELES